MKNRTENRRRNEREKCRVYKSFMDLEQVYDRLVREALLRQVLSMGVMGSKHLNRIKSMY